jgi:succinylarginine dihydrolase
MNFIESNFDGLVGPTHNYAGLSLGNVASIQNANKPSNPKMAALQGLAKMRALHACGLKQGVLPPQARPHLPTLRQLGFAGRDEAILAQVLKEAPTLLAAVSSASSMWTANAATVSPSANCEDGKVHFTPANLASNLHRSLEPETTARVLQAVFSGESFVHHDPLPTRLGDEGAANHSLVFTDHGCCEVFVYGEGGSTAPSRFPARQHKAAGEAIARLHGLKNAVHVQQNPDVIDAGVFHNDVIAVAHRQDVLHHEQAFVAIPALAGVRWHTVSAAELSVEQAVKSYLFNSQFLTLPNGEKALIVAEDTRENAAAWGVVQRWLSEGVVQQVQVFDLRQSMNNGGGPACLRLRVPLTDNELAQVNPRCWLDDALFDTLTRWVERHYRDRLVLKDLADRELLDESCTALDQLTQILGLGSVYGFQRV